MMLNNDWIILLGLLLIIQTVSTVAFVFPLLSRRHCNFRKNKSPTTFVNLLPRHDDPNDTIFEMMRGTTRRSRKMIYSSSLFLTTVEDDEDDTLLSSDSDQSSLFWDNNEEENNDDGIAVGVDLGTTNSAISILEDGIPRLIPIDGQRTMPSVVTLMKSDDYDDEGEDASPSRVRKNGSSSIIKKIVGTEACSITSSNENDERLIFQYRNVKRVMGMGTTSAAISAECVPHLLFKTTTSNASSSKIQRKGKFLNKKNRRNGMEALGLKAMIQDFENNPVRLIGPEWYNDDNDGDDNDEMTTMGEEKSTVTIDTTTTTTSTVTPEEISASILKKLFETVENSIGTNKKISRAVVGVPAYFNDMQRNSTIHAVEIASNIPYDQIHLLREPEAAALAYGVGKRQWGKGNDDEKELVLAFDLGGGTFDVSIVEVRKGVMEVIATGGNIMLGGSDFDIKIAQYLNSKIMEFGCLRNYWKDQGEVSNAMVTSAEQVRIALSSNRNVMLALPLSGEGWLNLEKPDAIILRGDHEYEDIDETGFSNSTHTICRLSRRTMETLCLAEFQALLRPVREVAIMAGVLLPGDANPAAVENALRMEEKREAVIDAGGGESIQFNDFFDNKSGEASDDQELENSSNDDDSNNLLQFESVQLKDKKKAQQRGRKRARDLRKSSKKFRQEKRIADSEAQPKSQVTKGNKKNVKIRDGIHGRRLTQIVLVGGATRMPAIGRLLASVTGLVPKRTVNPDHAVALGCAVQVGIFANDPSIQDLQVLDPFQAAFLRAFSEEKKSDMEEDDLEEFDEGVIFS